MNKRMLYLIIGPIASGKTTLAKSMRDNKIYINFDSHAHGQGNVCDKQNVPITIQKIAETIARASKEKPEQDIVVDGWFSFFANFWENEKEIESSIEILERTVGNLYEIIIVEMHRKIDNIMHDISLDPHKWKYPEYHKVIPELHGMYHEILKTYTGDKANG